jgi:hypothetical protein
MTTGEIVTDGRRPVGTVAEVAGTGLWQARCTLLHAGRHNCGRHPTKAAAVEAVLRATGVYSVWDV